MTDQTHADWLRDFVDGYDSWTEEELNWFKGWSVEHVHRFHGIIADLEAKDRTIAALTAERDRLREALKFYAAGRYLELAVDAGDKARAALKGETQ